MPEAFCEFETVRKKGLLNLWDLWEKKLYEVCKQPNRGNLTYHAPPCGGGVGGGATVLWVRNCALKGSVKSVRSVRDKTPQREIKIPTHYVSSPIGVTSHTTPISIRRGAGGEATIYSYRWKRYNSDDTLMFLRKERLFGKLFYPNFRIKSLVFYHKEEILKHVFLSLLSSKITT